MKLYFDDLNFDGQLQRAEKSQRRPAQAEQHRQNQ